MMRPALAALACLALASAAAAGEAQPSPEAIRAAADKVLSGDAYTLEDTSQYHLRIGEWIVERINDFFEWVSDTLGLGGMFGDLSSGAMYTILWVCVAILVAILVYNGYVLYKARRVAPEAFATIGAGRRLDPSELVEEAQRLAGEGNYVDASRRLFLAALIALENKRGGRVRQGLTNSEYLRSFQTPWVRENLRTFVELINWKWYRDQSFDAGDYERCRHAYDTILTQLAEMDA